MCRFCQGLGGQTAEFMGGVLAFEADRRAINITVNSLGTELARDDRRKLFSEFGLLYPQGQLALAACDDNDQVRRRRCCCCCDGGRLSDREPERRRERGEGRRNVDPPES